MVFRCGGWLRAQARSGGGGGGGRARSSLATMRATAAKRDVAVERGDRAMDSESARATEADGPILVHELPWCSAVVLG